MKKIIAISCVIICAICLVGCNNKNEKKDSDDKQTEKNILVGEWIADGTQKEFITNADGETVGGKKPYYLTIEKDNKYTLKMDDYTEKGIYEINEDNVTLKNNDGLISESCKLENDNELHCNNYASLYKRVEDKK